MGQRTYYLGIDLGTTNSAAAVFDGERISVVRTTQGTLLTPSIIRYDSRGALTVGAKAAKFLDSDPKNTRAEFKRLMGTATKLDFPAAKLARLPEELSAEVLRSLRNDVKDQYGFLPEQAVISVPALFELPQSAATTKAAQLAGFTKVELIQEPIASALAAGWTASEGTGFWLVYDLGGGTFDASLLETRDGMLRVVGHDGDNFLGGRDFDWAIVDWLLEEISKQEGVKISRADAKWASAIRKLKHAAEEAKIELTRSDTADISVPEFIEHEGRTIDVSLTLDRSRLEQLTAPLVARSIEVCRRLLVAQQASALSRIVLVGGPTMMPWLRRMVSEALQSPFAEGLDPMTLVAQGASVYAATAGLEMQPAKAESVSGCKLWLQFPAMSSDLQPYIVGKLLPEQHSPSSLPQRIRLIRADGLWQSPETAIDPEGGFVLQVELLPRRPNIFKVEGILADGKVVAMQPATVTIVQGLTIADPPLSRTISVARANNTCQVFFEKGTPLPARRTISLTTVESVAPAGTGLARGVCAEDPGRAGRVRAGASMSARWHAGDQEHADQGQPARWLAGPGQPGGRSRWSAVGARAGAEPQSGLRAGRAAAGAGSQRRGAGGEPQVSDRSHGRAARQRLPPRPESHAGAPAQAAAPRQRAGARHQCRQRWRCRCCPESPPVADRARRAHRGARRSRSTGQSCHAKRFARLPAPACW
jgi:molecular chaperone DnaK